MGVDLLSLSPELLMIVLSELDLSELVKCKQVCKALKELIDSVLPLKYKIECEVYGVVDNAASAMPLHQRMQRLEAMQRSWQADTPSHEFKVYRSSNDRSGTETLSGSLLAFQSSTHTIHVVQIPSGFRNIPRKEWDIDVPFDVGTSIYDIDQSQRLLIATETRGFPANQLDIYILDSETGATHPLAKNPRIELHVRPDLGADTCLTAVIRHDLVALVLVKEVLDDEDTELWVFNWKTGELRLNVFGLLGADFVFLESDLILLPVFPPAAHETLVYPLLLVLPCNNWTRMEAVKAPWICAFELPPPPHGAFYTNTQLFADFSSEPPHDANVPFRWDPRRGLLCVGLSHAMFELLPLSRRPNFRTVAESVRNLLIPLHTLASHIVRPPPTQPTQRTVIPWDVWSNGTLLLSATDAFVHAFSRTRAVISNTGDDNLRRAAIYDLNPYPVRRDPRLQGAMSNAHDAAHKIWLSPSSPAYRKFDWRAVDSGNSLLLMDDAIICAVRGAGGSCDYHIRAF